jgi:hypothetical protein
MNEPQAATEAERAQRQVLLWQKPFLPDHEIPAACDIPPTLWASLKQTGDSPPLFQLGRRLFVKTSDLRAWLDEKARAGRPGSKRLRAARGESA